MKISLFVPDEYCNIADFDAVYLYHMNTTTTQTTPRIAVGNPQVRGLNPYLPPLSYDKVVTYHGIRSSTTLPVDEKKSNHSKNVDAPLQNTVK